MVEAKINDRPIPTEEPAPSSGKVINLMDALRKSVQSDKSVERKPAAAAAKKGISLVKPKAQKRKSA